MTLRRTATRPLPALLTPVVLGAVLLAGCGAGADGSGEAADAPGPTVPTDGAVDGADDGADEGADGASDGAADGAGTPTDGPSAEGAGPSDDAAAGTDGGAARVAALLSGSSPVDYDPAAVTGVTLGGEAFDAAAVDGPVVYWFWAPWCTVCRAESGDVAAAAAATEGDITFVGVAGLGPADDMADFVAETGVDGFAHLQDADGSLWAQFGVVSQPSYVVVDATGDATLWPGGLAGDDLDQVTAALLG
ncbi:redoxin domain-containing protein [Jannaschia sp. R86511]|uniref:redoxin domain-containing protein n=1 Tax=Jannaschia sp. R86511 TaxID=3093853 RepID=UPI0036D21B6D